MAVDDFPLMADQRVLAAKIETTTGTFESLSASDGAFIVYNPEMNEESEPSTREDKATGSSDAIPSVPGTKIGRVTFECDYAGAGASGLPLWATTFLPACGMEATGSVYKFVTGATNQSTVSIGLYEDGKLRKMAGCQGTWTITKRPGQIARIAFDFRGVYLAEEDVELIAPTFPTIIPPIFGAASACTYDSVEMRASQVVIAANNDVQMREDPNAASGGGIRSAAIVSRRPTITLDPEDVLVATKDWHTYWTAGTLAAYSSAVGSAANNTITTAAAKAQVMRQRRGARNKMLVKQFELLCTRNAGADTDFTMTFS